MKDIYCCSWSRRSRQLSHWSLNHFFYWRAIPDFVWVLIPVLVLVIYVQLLTGFEMFSFYDYLFIWCLYETLCNTLFLRMIIVAQFGLFYIGLQVILLACVLKTRGSWGWTLKETSEPRTGSVKCFINKKIT